MINNEIPLGSGTLVELNGRPGILTAHHVVYSPYADLWLAKPGNRLFTTVASFSHSLSIPSDYLNIFDRSKRDSDEYGPDLAFISLPFSEFFDQLKARKSFYNLNKDYEIRLQESLEEIGLIAFCGYPAAMTKEGLPDNGFDRTVGLHGYAFLTGPDAYYQRDGRDYFELGVSSDDCPDIRSFGEVSGGGVWRIPILRKGNDPNSKIEAGTPIFCGVAFYEETRTDPDWRFIRTHAPRSIYIECLSLCQQ